MTYRDSMTGKHRSGWTVNQICDKARSNVLFEAASGSACAFLDRAYRAAMEAIDEYLADRSISRDSVFDNDTAREMLTIAQYCARDQLYT